MHLSGLKIRQLQSKCSVKQCVSEANFKNFSMYNKFFDYFTLTYVTLVSLVLK